MDVSIIIVNFNTPELLEDCVESIKKSKIKSKYEVIVVDNGSNQDSIQKLKELKTKKLIDKVILNKKNLGFSKANNKGIENSKGKYKLLLNSDTIIKKQSVDNLIKFTEKTTDAGVVASRLLNKDGTIQASCFNFPSVKSAIVQYWLKARTPMDKYFPNGKDSVLVDAVVGASFLITPKAIKKVGLLDERYFMYFEDLDYCRKVWRTGLKVYYLPSSEIIHLHGQSGKKISDTSNQWKRLIPSSKIYHGLFRHYALNFILWSGQKLRKF